MHAGGPMTAATGSWLSQVRARVDARLQAFLDDKRRQAARLSEPNVQLVEAVAGLTLRGGKRLRPATLYAGFVAADAKGDAQHTDDAGAALELLQTYLLIHDDWMDGDDERRGAPSVHAHFRDAFGDEHLGASLGVLAGDLASGFAWELLGEAPFPAGRGAEGHAAFAKLHQEVVFGQQLDLLKHADVALVHQLKTGSYTVRGPLCIGALLGNASTEQLAALERYGEPLGLAFQLRDDLLGTFGDPSATGKPTWNDIRAGKNTSLIAAARARLSDVDNKLLQWVLGNPESENDQVSQVVTLLESCGARAEIETRIDALLSQAKSALAAAPLSAEGTALLGQLADMLGARHA